MTKLNTTSANLSVINDEQLTQVVGGHGRRNHRREYNHYCRGGSGRDNYNSDRGCYDRGCYGDSSYGDSSYGGSNYGGSNYGSYSGDSSSSGSSDE
jgi:hypothetical protein